MTYNKYMDSYFMGCKLIGKKPWWKTTPGQRTVDDWERKIFLFILPAHERGKDNRPLFGALFPDGSPQVWQKSWAKDRKVIDVTDADREECKQYQEYLIANTKLPERYQRFADATQSVQKKISRVRLIKNLRVRLRK